MSVKERVKAFDSQSISLLTSESTLPRPSGNGSPSNYASLDASQNSRSGDSPLPSYTNGQAVQTVNLGAGALELEDMPPPLLRRPSSPGGQEDGDLIILDADECSELSSSKDAAHLLQSPLSHSTQSSNAKMPSTNRKRPPPVANKSEALLQKYKILLLAKEPSRLPRSNCSDVPLSNNDDRTIVMIDNDRYENENFLADKDMLCDREPPSARENEPKDAQNNSVQQGVVSKTFSNEIQQLVKRPPPKPAKPDEIKWKLSQTMDPLFINAKHNLDHVGQMTKPVVAGAGFHLEWMRADAKNAIDNIVDPRLFMNTKDDFMDVAAKASGKDGLCSKCQGFSNDIDQIHKQVDGSKKDFEWATPLSRIIYHADWCRICRLLLNMLCEPAHDPLLHPAVAPYVQPEIEGATMKEWTAKGWKYTDSHWPFGHGDKRHVGATYVLGPASQAIKSMLPTSLPAIVDIGYLVAKPSQLTLGSVQKVTDHTRDARHHHQLKVAQTRDPHPLSCIIRITTNAPSASESPGLLIVELLGYGRKIGADLKALSQFRLRFVSSASTNEVEDPKPLQLKRSLGSFSYGRLLDEKWIDPSIGSLWLRQCESRHGPECNEHGWAIAMEKPKFLRVVDVQD